MGELEDFEEWINKNVTYSSKMLKDKIQGMVMLSFSIDKKGKVKKAKVIGKLSPDADAEALRVLPLLGKWKPGENNGKLVETLMTASIKFVLPENSDKWK